MSEEKITNKAQRKRAQNFSEAEKMILINLVQENKDVLENKKSDAVTSKDKDKCWKIIEHLFNSRSSSEYRNSEVLRSCWDNLKKKTRKFFADEKMQLYKTGGGFYQSKSDVLLEHVREVIKPSVDGITNNFDSDTIGDNLNLCKLPITNTNTNTNLYEATTSNINNSIIEWLDDTDESINENDILNVLKNRNATGMGEKSSNNVLNIYTALDNDNENNINESSGSDLNTNNRTPINLHCMDNISKGKMQKTEKQNIDKTSAVGILTSKISAPLRKRNLLKHEDNLGKVCKERKYKRQESITEKISQYKILGDTKIELVQFMVEDLKTKSDIEIKILQTQLEKEKLEVQILEKELELKENMLESKQQKLRF